MPEERSPETVRKIRAYIREKRNGYHGASNPNYSAEYDAAYEKAKALIASGVRKLHAYAEAGIHPDAFRRRKKWEESRAKTE